MANTNTPRSRRSGVATASLASALFFGLIAFASGSAFKSLEDAVVGILFSCWVALPLVLLGVIKLFRAFPGTHSVLLVFGFFASVCAVASTHSGGSTSALGLVFFPFWLLLIYGVVCFVLLCVRVYSK